MTKGYDWQNVVGRAWAELYRQTDRSFSGLTPHLLERIAPLPGVAVLDIGCGAGELALALARARPMARAVGLDVSANLLDAARHRAGERDQISFIEADAASWQSEGFVPDLLVSRHGVMFFDDPPAAFFHLRAIAAPGANLVFSCFRSPDENPWASEIAAMLPASGPSEPPDPYAAGPFAFARPDHVRAILSAGGWRDIGFEPFDYAYIAGQGEDPVGDALAFFARIGPAALAMREMPDAVRDSFRESLQDWLKAHRDGNLVIFPAAAWIVTARNG